MNRPPLPVTLIGCGYIAAGAVGFVYHLSDFKFGFAWQTLGVELVRVAAIVAGIFILRARNWARWLAIAWMAFHVAISMLHGWPEAAMHAVFLALVAWGLWTRRSQAWFQPGVDTPANHR